MGLLAADYLEKNMICVPADVDTKAAIRLFLDRATTETDKRTEGVITMYRALAAKYPCR